MRNVSKKDRKKYAKSFSALMCKKLRDRRSRVETLENLMLAHESRQNSRTLLVIIGSTLN